MQSTFKEALTKIWYEKSIGDYENKYYCNEDTLKSRLYLHLTEELGRDYFKKNNLRLFTEYWIPELKFKADMALIDISGDWEILSIVELKCKHLNSNTTERIEEDYDKMKKYNKLSKDIDLFMVSVNDNVEEELQGTSWIKVFGLEGKWHNKRLTEMILDNSGEEIECRVYDWFYKSNKEKVLNYVNLNEGICDDCLSEKTRIEPRQQVNQICRNHDYIGRTKEACCQCNKVKTVNIITNLI